MFDNFINGFNHGVGERNISLSSGSERNIEDVKIGDLIKTFNEKTGEIEDKEVLLIQTSKSSKFIEIEFEDGTKNTNTFSHPYFIKGKGWSSYDEKEAIRKYGITVSKLSEGDTGYKIVKGKLIELKIIKIRKIMLDKKTYNLSNVKDNHNFFANKVLVHNRS